MVFSIVGSLGFTLEHFKYSERVRKAFFVQETQMLRNSKVANLGLACAVKVLRQRSLRKLNHPLQRSNDIFAARAADR